MEELSVTARDGFVLAAQVSGAPAGPPLLLLQGQANSHLWWTDLRPGFEDSFRVITFDWRGTGGSRGPVGDWTTRVFADDTALVLSALGIERSSVYATSMGGRVAQLLAADSPGQVGRLALACTSPGGPHAQERSNDVRRDLAAPKADERLRNLHRLFYTEAWPHGPERSHLLGDASMTATERRAHLRASGSHDAWDAIPLITAPTLVLHGVADRMTPADNATLIAGRIPNADLYLHPLGRHGFFEEFAGEVTPRVSSFLQP